MEETYRRLSLLKTQILEKLCKRKTKQNKNIDVNFKKKEEKI